MISGRTALGCFRLSVGSTSRQCFSSALHFRLPAAGKPFTTAGLHSMAQPQAVAACVLPEPSSSNRRRRGGAKRSGMSSLAAQASAGPQQSFAGGSQPTSLKRLSPELHTAAAATGPAQGAHADGALDSRSKRGRGRRGRRAGGADFSTVAHATSSPQAPPRPMKAPGNKSSGEPGSPASSSSRGADTSDLRFADMQLSAETKQALAQDFGYEYATPVQAATVQPALAGRDLLARARTGTGKTLGFGIPAVERIAAMRGPRQNFGQIRCVIVSPTRELASQIAEEVKRLCKPHGRHMGVQLVVGGTNRNAEAKRIQSEPNTIFVCTPGRFHDHVENTSGFRNRLNDVELVVLDECDRLLDMGFRPDIVRLLQLLPDPSRRQTLLYSATMPTDLNSIVKLALRPDYEYINCVGADAPETATNAKQSAAVVPKTDWLPRLAQIISEGTLVPNYKIMVFCTTARTVAFLAHFFRVAGLPGVMEIHSRMSQSARTRESNAFRESKGGSVIFTSDVSARGVDYPDTTLIVQCGAPTDRETYVHRLGRTARANTEGEGFLLLIKEEEAYLQKLKGIPIETRDLGPMPGPNDVAWRRAVDNALSAVPHDEELNKRAQRAYGAWLGYMNGQKILRWSKPQLVQEASEFAQQIGLKEQPRMDKRTIGKMGLKGVPGILYTESSGRR